VVATGCEMVATWLRHGCDMVATWLRNGCDMVAKWLRHGCEMVATIVVNNYHGPIVAANQLVQWFLATTAILVAANQLIQGG
jgi:hypothetical protein